MNREPIQNRVASTLPHALSLWSRDWVALDMVEIYPLRIENSTASNGNNVIQYQIRRPGAKQINNEKDRSAHVIPHPPPRKNETGGYQHKTKRIT